MVQTPRDHLLPGLGPVAMDVQIPCGLPHLGGQHTKGSFVLGGLFRACTRAVQIGLAVQEVSRPEGTLGNLKVRLAIGDNRRVVMSGWWWLGDMVVWVLGCLFSLDLRSTLLYFLGNVFT